MKSVCFISGSKGVTYLYRVIHAAQACERLGFRAKTFEPRTDAEQDADEVLKELGRGDTFAVVCHRVPLSPSLLKIARACRLEHVQLIYDTDDLIFDLEFARLFERLKIASRQILETKVRAFARAIKLCQHAWCSTSMIARGLTKLGVHSVTIIPNTFSEAARTTSDSIIRERSQQKEKGSEVIIGFGSGSGTHAIDINSVAEPLACILQDFNFTRFYFLGKEEIPKPLQRYRDRIDHKKPVPHADLLAVMSDWDINIAPLERTVFTEAKSPLKFIEAALVEVPTIATPTEPFASAIQNGVTGKIANSEQEWYDALRALVVNPRQRRALGRAARVDVIERFGPNIKYHSLKQALAKLWDGLVPI